jgi:hypothetical protein
MIPRRQFSPSLRGRAFPLLASLLLLAACGGSPAGPAVSPTPTPTEQEIARRAVDRLGAVQSFHFDLATDTGGKPVGGGSGLALVSATGDAARPDELSASLQASVGGFVAAVKYISAGGKHYMTDPLSQQWIEVPPQFNTIAVFSPDSGASSIVNSLEGLKRQGVESIDGLDSYHLAGTAPGSVLQPLLGASAPSPLKADVWIGAADSLTRRIILTGPIFQGDPDATVRTLNLSKFDQPVTISAPTPGTRPT